MPDPQEQRRLVRSGCATAVGLLALVVAPVAGYVAFARFLRSATLGAATPDLLVLHRIDSSAEAIAWTVPIVLTAALGLMAFARSGLGLVLYGSLPLALGAAGLFYGCYGEFVALRTTGGRDVELIYLWPRPSLRLDPQGAEVAIETTINPTDNAGALADRIVIERAGVRYASTVSGAAQQAQALLVSRGARKGAARRAW